MFSVVWVSCGLNALSPQLGVPFGKSMEPLGNRAFLKEVSQSVTVVVGALRLYRQAPLPVNALLPEGRCGVTGQLPQLPDLGSMPACCHISSAMVDCVP